MFVISDSLIETFFADRIADYFYVIAESGYNGYTLPFKSCEVSKLVAYFLRN